MRGFLLRRSANRAVGRADAVREGDRRNRFPSWGRRQGGAVGDYDNDGDLDIFQAAGGSAQSAIFGELSPFLMNLGEGQFLNVTEGVGLIDLPNYLSMAALADTDNDGDLDLMSTGFDFQAGSFPVFYLNNGDGTFEKNPWEDGLVSMNESLTFGAFDGDGFLDTPADGDFYRNQGNDNHYLRVEPVGVQSNRSGIGARLIATAGELQQMQEILGGERVRAIRDGRPLRTGSAHPGGRTGDPLAVGPGGRAAGDPGGSEDPRVRGPVVLPRGPADRLGEPVGFCGGGIDGGLPDGGPAGTFYLDDIRLVAARPSSAPVTAVTEPRTAAVPAGIILAQNFPNPFNGETVIRFALPESREVELTVFNLAGQKVATLVSGRREAGTYAVRWDGRDLASGMYLYRLRAGQQQVATRKMLLVR